jgi:hypothetical protein
MAKSTPATKPAIKNTTAASEAPAAQPTILQVKEPWATTVDGAVRMIRPGETFVAGHPLLRGNEHRVKPFAITYDHERDAAADEAIRAARAELAAAQEAEREAAAAAAAGDGSGEDDEARTAETSSSGDGQPEG